MAHECLEERGLTDKRPIIGPEMFADLGRRDFCLAAAFEPERNRPRARGSQKFFAITPQRGCSR